MRKAKGERRNAGVTLIELLVVLMILSLILTAAVKTWDVTLERGRFEQTRQKLDKIALAITGDPNYIVGGVRADFGFIGDMGVLPRSLTDLAVKPDWVSPPESSLWRGPYIKGTFAQSPEGYRIDAWGDTIIFHRDSLFLRSYGGGGLVNRSRWITRSLGYSVKDVLQNKVTGWVYDQFGNPPPDSLLQKSEYRLVVELNYPRNGVIYRDDYTMTPGSNGRFEFQNVPQGVHRLIVRFWCFVPPPGSCDSVVKMVTVFPRAGAQDIEVRMNVNWANPSL
ncbi:MAG: prepilin-type N-terminal cleavage/methylation domain-containing protein [candidate division WOR-3 bacterium]